MNYLSAKFNFNRTENELAKLHQIAKDHPNFIDLTASNPTLFFEYEMEVIQKAISSRNIFPYTPDPNGLKEARLAIVNYYKPKGRELNFENFFFTSGTSEAMSFILKALCDSNSEIFSPTPGYPLYDFIFQLENIFPKNYKLYPQKTDQPNRLKWKIDFENLEKNLTKKTKAIIIVEPHNPTGSKLCLEDAEKIASIAKERELVLIIDEVFSDYYPDFYKSNPYLEVNCIFLNGISKTLALPQLKLSWIYLSGKQAFVAQMKEALEIITDTYLSVNMPVQIGLKDLLATAEDIQTKIKNQISENKKCIVEKLKDNQFIEFFLPDGGWYILLKLKDKFDDETFSYQILKNKNVYTYPGYMFDMPDEKYIVISLIVDSKSFEEGINRIISFFENI